MNHCDIKETQRVRNIASNEWGTIAMVHKNSNDNITGFSVRYDGSEGYNYHVLEELNLFVAPPGVTMQVVHMSALEDSDGTIVDTVLVRDDTNPKDKIGRKKVAMELVPPSAKAHMAHAFMDGAAKYGAYNWREKKVSAMVYIGAMMRHIDAYLDGEDVAPDSGAQHLGHAQACCGILLDAAATGNLIDDRPTKGNASALHAELHKLIVERS